MKHLGLFEGIGGFSLAARWAGWETVAWCEWNPYCQQVLKHHFPDAEGHGDITKTDFTKYANRIDIVTGGFPCQKFSIAGSKTGDDTFIREMLRAIGEIKPRWVVAENVSNILNKKFQPYLDLFISGLEGFGYQEPVIFDCSADACNIPTMERHVWFITEANGKRPEGCIKKAVQTKPILQGELQGGNQGGFGGWELPTSRVCSLGEGFPERLDVGAISPSKWHGESLQALGNAVVPQIPFEIFKVINQLNDTI